MPRRRGGRCGRVGAARPVPNRFSWARPPRPFRAHKAGCRPGPRATCSLPVAGMAADSEGGLPGPGAELDSGPILGQGSESADVRSLAPALRPGCWEPQWGHGQVRAAPCRLPPPVRPSRTGWDSLVQVHRLAASQSSDEVADSDILTPECGRLVIPASCSGCRTCRPPVVTVMAWPGPGLPMWPQGLCSLANWPLSQPSNLDGVQTQPSGSLSPLGASGRRWQLVEMEIWVKGQSFHFFVTP